jgi:enterochelin esterase-like enzyme
MRDSFYNDSPDGQWPIESVIIKEMVPHVDQTYRTIAKREARGVEGFSMGGYGAAHLGFKYPELFGMVGVMSGDLITTETLAGGPNLAPIFKKMFNSDAAYFDANHPMTLARKNADAIRGRTAIRIAVGGNDNLQVPDKALHELLQELKIEHEWEVVPGVGHVSTLFYDKLGDHAFAWYLKALQ